jgi:alpha-galactosidase
LPSAAKDFEAIGALNLDWFGRGDSSDQATFSVEVDGKEAASPVLIVGGGAGVPIRADLHGAREFVLFVGHPTKPQSPTIIWADARVLLEDGRSIWLDDLPVSPLADPPTLEPPFSFRYGGIPSSEILNRFSVTRRIRQIDGVRIENTTSYRDSQSGLLLRLVSIRYRDFPTVEWTLYLKNDGTLDTPVIEDLKALDVGVERDGDGEFTLHHFKGTQTTSTDFEPFETELRASQSKEFESDGRPTSKDLCYFNLAWPGRGVIIGLGWPGQWVASFKRDTQRGVRLTAGQAHTHFLLHPGEEARTPLVALQFWNGEWTDGQNVWRRWMLAHNVPREIRDRGAKPVLWACYSSYGEEYAEIDEAKNLRAINQYLDAGIKLDYWEMDAGWYVNNGKWVDVGTWVPDPKRFSGGLRPLFNFVHSKGLRMQLWFEPERASRGSWLWDNHPEWLLRSKEWESNDTEMGNSRLLNLGNPEARNWLVGMLNQFIDQGIDFYRTDFNFDPLPFWQAADALNANRQGICENKYVVGYLAYFDELLIHHPKLMIDTCASGGRRMDLETLRRAIPVTRSDYFAEPAGAQNLTYGIASWVPVYGTGTVGHDLYTNRSAWGPWPGIGWDLGRKGMDVDKLRRMSDECRSLVPFFYGDYYPLTAYDPSNRAWIAWQFDRPDLGSGVIQAFRRTESPYDSASFRLRGLDPEARYELTNIDTLETKTESGAQFMEIGFRAMALSAPEALIFKYRKHEHR